MFALYCLNIESLVVVQILYRITRTKMNNWHSFEINFVKII